MLIPHSILIIFRLMACDAFYAEHTIANPPLDRCALRDIESRTAREVAIIGMSTTLFGLANLLFAAWCIKKLGVKRALLIQIFWPAVRLAIQNVGAMTGGSRGILIMQASQVITVVGGPNGYVLALNSFITDVVRPEERTGALGQIQGYMMMGSAVGFLVGGVVGDAFGILAPFRMTLLLFLLSCLYVALALPSIPADKETGHGKEKTVGFKRFFGPLHIFAPQKWTLRDGRTSRQYGALMLGIGVFLAITATGYINTLLQMYATTTFGFGTAANGYLIFIYSSLRGLYLSLAFPRIINIGRRWLQPPSTSAAKIETTAQVVGALPNQIDVADPMDAETEPPNPPERENEQETFAFDLLYARCSLLADGILTGLCVFISEGWQMYIAAILIPLAAGTGSASKGSILQMIPSRDRVDALSGITLVENVARLSTGKWSPVNQVPKHVDNPQSRYLASFSPLSRTWARHI